MCDIVFREKLLERYITAITIDAKRFTRRDFTWCMDDTELNTNKVYEIVLSSLCRGVCFETDVDVTTSSKILEHVFGQFQFQEITCSQSATQLSIRRKQHECT